MNSIRDYIFKRNVATASHVSGTNFSVAAQGQGFGMVFRPDGTRVYCQLHNTDRIYQYNLATAWDITTASLGTSSPAMTAQDNTPKKFYITPDGLTLFCFGSQNETIHKYTFGTAWLISTLSYSGTSWIYTDGLAFADEAITFSDDGLYLFIEYNNVNIRKYTMSIAWDITTLAYSGQSLAVGTTLFDFKFAPNGKKIYVMSGSIIREFVLTTAYNLSTATLRSTCDISAYFSSNFASFCIGDNGNSFYTLGYETVPEMRKIFQSTLSQSWTFPNQPITVI